MEEKAIQIISDAKHTFSTEHGQKFLEHLRRFCRADVRQSCFDEDNERKTAYNLGANSVYRYIVMLIESKVNDDDEIITEPDHE